MMSTFPIVALLFPYQRNEQAVENMVKEVLTVAVAFNNRGRQTPPYHFTQPKKTFFAYLPYASSSKMCVLDFLFIYVVG